MAFIPASYSKSSFVKTGEGRLCSKREETSGTRTLLLASGSGKKGGRPSNSSGFRPFERNGQRGFNNGPGRHRRLPDDFQPFDGSVPLLPPWRPESLEQAFNYASMRVHRPVSSDDASSDRLVRLQCPGHATLYAHVLQYSDKQDSESQSSQKVWLRPLLLDAIDSDCSQGFLDLRGVSDLVVHSRFVHSVDDPQVALSVKLNLAATHADTTARVALDDGAFSHVASDALFEFVKRMYNCERGS